MNWLERIVKLIVVYIFAVVSVVIVVTLVVETFEADTFPSPLWLGALGGIIAGLYVLWERLGK